MSSDASSLESEQDGNSSASTAGARCIASSKSGSSINFVLEEACTGPYGAAVSTTSISSTSQQLQQMEATRTGSSVEPGLVRAVPIRLILRTRAEKFASNEGTVADYKLSAPTDEIDYFLSHSWRASRHAKYLTLWVFFRLPTAVVGAVTFGTIAFVLTATRVLPATHTAQGRWPDTRGDLETESSMWCQAFSVIGLVLALMAQEFAEWHNLVRGSTCFLDKLCIHQCDTELKSRGIRSIGLFVCRSRYMLILWSPEYFTRLWCCFEVAAFQQGEREAGGKSRRPSIIFRPLVLGPAVVTLGICLFLVFLWQRFALVARSSTSIAKAVVIGSLALTSSITAPVLFPYTRSRQDLFHQLKTFSFADAQCFDPADRALITRLLQRWHATAGDEGAAVAAFEQEVREDIGALVQEQMGDALPYVIAVQVCVCAGLGFGLDCIAERFFLPEDALGTSRAEDLVAISGRILGVLLLFKPACMRAVLCIATLLAPRQADGGSATHRARCAAFSAAVCTVMIVLDKAERDIYWLYPGIGGLLSSIAFQACTLVVAYQTEVVLATLRRLAEAIVQRAC